MGASIRGRGRRRRVMSEINITPLTDVCLVLLIIFMTTAKFLGAGESVDVELPGASTVEPTDVVDAIEVEVSEDSRIAIDGVLVDRAELVATFHALSGGMPRAVVLSADKYAEYGLVYEVMDAARMANLTAVSLAAEPIRLDENGNRVRR